MAMSGFKPGETFSFVNFFNTTNNPWYPSKRYLSNVRIFYSYVFEDLDDFVRLGGLGHGGDVEDDPLRHGDDREAEVKVKEVEEVLLQERCRGHLYTDRPVAAQQF